MAVRDRAGVRRGPAVVGLSLCDEAFEPGLWSIPGWPSGDQAVCVGGQGLVPSQGGDSRAASGVTSEGDFGQEEMVRPIQNPEPWNSAAGVSVHAQDRALINCQLLEQTQASPQMPLTV